MENLLQEEYCNIDNPEHAGGQSTARLNKGSKKKKQPLQSDGFELKEESNIKKKKAKNAEDDETHQEKVNKPKKKKPGNNLKH